MSKDPAKSRFISSFANDNVGSFVVCSLTSKTLTAFQALIAKHHVMLYLSVDMGPLEIFR